MSALSILSCLQTLQASLSDVSASVSSVPDVSTYISALTPAVNAFNALPASIFTDVQNSLTTINGNILQARISWISISSSCIMHARPKRWLCFSEWS